MEETSQTAAGDVGMSQDPIGMQAQEAIGSLILLSPEERKGLNDYDIEQCEARIQELLQVIRNPPKDRRVADVLGQLSLLYQRRLMLEIDRRVKLQFELNDTLQMVDVLRGELTEVGNRLETIEGSQATPPSLEEWGGEQKPTSQVETFEGEPYLRYPERTCRSDQRM
ncbi:hypothetical protein AMECASPLE_031680 [Ameca splendens]|uniref:Biogenesis of lysosome-related organelles complex 1 subunit 7 n=1 Tax=Ameca splendens TaxID=208324 RepID=A0ABV0ZF62_9TELE